MAQRQNDASGHRSVFVSTPAANMVSSLHPFDKAKVNAALTTIKASVLDPNKIQQIVGVDNAFVAHAGNLRVIFERDGESIVITSVVAKT